MNIDALRGKYAGETAWIVGKGPSLGYLRAEHFGKGPVIALNQAIAVVEWLGLNNPLYSLQKDGCGLEGAHEVCELRDGYEWMIRPKGAVLIVQNTKGYSRDCLRDYKPRMAVDVVKELKFKYEQTMAVRMGIALVKIMGCKEVWMMCCESLTNRNAETYNVHTGKAELTSAGSHYLESRTNVLNELASIRHHFLNPR